MAYRKPQQKPMQLRDNLRMYRRRMGMTQQEVADRLGVSRTSYTKYETGVCEPGLEMVIQLAKMFGTDINTLFSDRPETAAVRDAAGEELSAEERDILLAYRSLKNENKDKAWEYIGNLRSKELKEKNNS